MEVNNVFLGDCLEMLRGMPDNYCDCLVSDPPYQLDGRNERWDNATDFAKGQSDVGKRLTRGFMGKTWDVLPTTEILKECLRVLKDGAFSFWLMTPRQDSMARFICRLQDAGFDTGFTSIYWTYASGFPKATNIGKAVDKKLGVEQDVVGFRKKASLSVGETNEGWVRPSHKAVEERGGLDITEPTSDEAKSLDGSYAGFQPKPAVEIIIVAMKPLSEKAYTDQALKNKKGISWLDDCRVPYDKKDHVMQYEGYSNGQYKSEYEAGTSYKFGNRVQIDKDGRFPANLLCGSGIDVNLEALLEAKNRL